MSAIRGVRPSHFQAVPLTDDVVEWRERPHDDLVLAVAVAAWKAERGGGFRAVVVDPTYEVPSPPWWNCWLNG